MPRDDGGSEDDGGEDDAVAITWIVLETIIEYQPASRENPRASNCFIGL